MQDSPQTKPLIYRLPNNPSSNLEFGFPFILPWR